MMKYDLLARYFGASYRCHSGRSGNKLDMLKAFGYYFVYLLLFVTSYKRMLHLCGVETPDYLLSVYGVRHCVPTCGLVALGVAKEGYYNSVSVRKS